MKRLSLLLLSFFIFFQCATYKELKPKPELVSSGSDFIELKNDDEMFELDKDKKYFIGFPAAPDKNYYLVLDITDKAVMNSYLTDTFDDGKGRIIEIPDETDVPESRSVFSVDNSVQKFYWVIDLVRRDFALEMNYRYVEKWRYKFESRYAAFMQTFTENKADSTGYLAFGSDMNFQGYDYNSKTTQLQHSSQALDGMIQELNEIEAIFPPSIKNTTDEAYLNYLDLKTKLETEIAFQKDYLFVLNLFKNAVGPIPGFSANVDDYLTFYQNESRYPASVSNKLGATVSTTLPKLATYYNQDLKAKNDSKAIDIPVAKIQNLISTANITAGASYNILSKFVFAYNSKTEALNDAENKFNEIESSVENYGQMPTNTYFSKQITKLSKLQYNLPKSGSSAYSNYSNYNCVNIQTREINSLRRRVNDLLDKYRYADTLIPKINAMKAQKNYGAMLKLIKENNNLPFLKNLYKDLDNISLNEHKRKIKQALAINNWSAAETALRNLNNESNFLNSKSSLPIKNKLARTYNDSLYNRIERISLQNARKLMNENIATTDNVEDLYQSAAFLPVHQPSYSVDGPAAAKRRMDVLIGKLNNIKEKEFPTKAITALYSDFTSNSDQNGVMKARAVVVHGSHYKGDDSKIKMRVGECDPWASKWITKAKEYRKVYALPTTTNQGGTNTYVFRMNIRIPTNAKFPVYDLNIKLPKEVAASAGASQWYEKIMLNKDPVKNEGRYTVTAPTASNNYEFQITPIRMLAEGDNVLEVHFKHKSFKAFPVSVMAQKPIIKKN